MMVEEEAEAESESEERMGWDGRGGCVEEEEETMKVKLAEVLNAWYWERRKMWDEGGWGGGYEGVMHCLEDAFVFLRKHRLVTGMLYTDVCMCACIHTQALARARTHTHTHTHTHTTHTHTYCGSTAWEQAKKSLKYKPGYNWPTNSVSPTPIGTSPPPHLHPQEEEETQEEETAIPVKK